MPFNEIDILVEFHYNFFMVTTPSRRVINLFYIVLFFLMLILLIGFILAGTQSRYLADDYCYDAQFIKQGFWHGQIDSYIESDAVFFQPIRVNPFFCVVLGFGRHSVYAIAVWSGDFGMGNCFGLHFLSGV